MWFKVDDKLATHPKALDAGLRAMGLWVLAGSWCGQHLTDGFIPTRVITGVLGGRTADAQALVRAGLWTTTDGGYQFHAWNEYQPAATDVKKKQEAETEKKRRQRARGHLNVVHDDRGRFTSKDDR